VGWSGTMNSSVSLVERSTIHLASCGLGHEGVCLCRLSSRCGSFNPELHCCCYEVGIHQSSRHHNTGDRDGGFDRSDVTCLPGYFRPLTRLYDATQRDAKAIPVQIETDPLPKFW